MTLCHRGRIREEVCSDHKHVEWEVDYASLTQHYGIVSSPTFEIEAHRYRLELRPYSDSVVLNIFRMGPLPKGLVRCFLGLKRGDGSYHHEIRRKLFEQEECLFWIDNFQRSSLEKQYLAPDGHLTFFVRMDVQYTKEAEKKCAVEMNPTSHGRIRKAECNGHNHVEWDVKYSSLPDYDYIPSSPIFEIGAQRYLLDLHITVSTVYLRLFHTGPPSNRPVRCFSGVKCSDGRYHYEIMSSIVYLKNECEVWTQELSHNFLRRVFESRHLGPGGRVTFFLRIDEEQTQLGKETCSYGAAEMTPSGGGYIRQEECSGHYHVQWIVEYELQPEYAFTLSSPSFQIGFQRYLLDLHYTVGIVSLRLFRLGPSSKRSVRCLVGVRGEEGSFLHGVNNEMDLTKHCDLWTLVWSHNFPRYAFEGLRVERQVTFFLRMKEKTQSEAKACPCCDAMITPRGEGCIREEECNGHKHVEWDVEHASMPLLSNCWSPAFGIEAQRYILQLHRKNSHVSLTIYRTGPSSRGNVRFFLGLKRSDGVYHHNITSGEIDLGKECEMWAPLKLQKMVTFKTSELERCYSAPIRRLTFFLRMSVQCAQDGEETCNQVATKMTPLGEGRIREEECKGHKHVEWDVKYESLTQDGGTLISPVFQIEAQRYLLELSDTHSIVELNLFRTGMSSKEPVPCFAGIKFGDGSYPHRISSYVLDQEKDCEMWACVNRLSYFARSDLESRHLTVDRSVTFFVRMNVKQTGAEMCSHGIANISPPGVGIISEKEWTSFKQVEWNLDFEPSPGFVTSPVFSVADQNYLWELSCNENDSPELNLFRMGPSVNKSVRWWYFANHGDISYIQYGNGCGQLNLRDEMCAMWKPVGKSFRLKYLDERIPLVVGFLMSLEKTQSAAKAYILADGHSQQDLKPGRGEDVVFRIENREYKMHRAVLAFRAPVFKAMFSHDFTESRTGVVHIEDCEHDIFRAFLDFVYRGQQEIVTSKNSFALYSVADKYMFDELKRKCFKKMKLVIVSVDNFFDVVKFSLVYELYDVLGLAIEFLTDNKGITKTEAWRDFSGNNSDVAKYLLFRVMVADK